MLKVASFFWSMQVWVSGGAWKVHATIGSMLHNNDLDFTYIQMEDRIPRYEYNGHIIDLHEKFYEWFWIRKIISLFRLVYIIKCLCKKNSYDVLLWQWDFFFMVTWLSKLFWNKTKCVALVHTTLRIWPRFVQYILVLCLKMNDYIVCISKEEKNYLWTLWIKDKKFSLISNSIDIKWLALKYTENIEEWDQYLFDRWIFTFISVWRFTDQKNFKLLINSYVEYKQVSKKESQLIIIWDGEHYDEYCHYVSKLWMHSSIHLIWRRNNPMSYLRNAHCFVLSSKFEWYPMVLLEACVAELSIISMDCPTWPAELLNESKWWILVPFYNNDKIDKKALSIAMLEIENKDLKILWSNNRNFVRKFDNSVIADMWNAYVRKIVK